MIEIKQLSKHQIQEFSNMRLQADVITCDSPKIVLKAINENLTCYKLLCTKEFFDEYSETLSNVPKQNLFVCSKQVATQITGHNIHHGTIGIFQKPKEIEIKDIQGPVVISNGITSAENIGSLMRNSSGLGVENLIFDDRSCSPWTRRAIRVSMGNVFNLNIHTSNNLKEAIFSLKENGYHVIAASIHGQLTSLYKYCFPKNFALIIGSEGHGLSDEILELADTSVYIPMFSDTQALNAATSAAVILSEIRRQQLT